MALLDQVPRIAPPELDSFERDWLTPALPVVIEGALSGSRAQQRWTPDYLAALLGGVRVPVVVSEDGLSATIPGQPQRWRVLELPFEDAVRLVVRPDPPTCRFFIMQKTISKKMALLALDLDRPRWMPKSGSLSNNLWIGSDGVTTPLHFDVANNFLAMFGGRKHFTLFPPGDGNHLDPLRDWDARNPNRSRIDLDAPSPSHLEQLRHTHPVRTTLNAGDLLYVPPLWWHHVRSEGISIAVNFWWKPRLLQCLGGVGPSMLVSEWKRDRMAALERLFDLAPAGTRLEAALALLNAGHPGLAALVGTSAGAPIPSETVALACGLEPPDEAATAGIRRLLAGAAATE